MKKILLIGFLLFLLSGTPYTELNNIRIVDTIGIGKTEDGYYLYIRTVPTNNDDETVYRVEGKSLGSLFQETTKLAYKTAYYKHLGTVIIESSLLEANSQEIIYFLKEKFTQINYLLLTTPDLAAFFATDIDTYDLEQFIKQEQATNGTIHILTFDQLYANFLDPLEQAAIPQIRVQNQEINVAGLQIIDESTVLNQQQARSHYLLSDQLTKFQQTMTLDQQAYHLQLDNLHTTIRYQNNTLTIKIKGVLDSDDFVANYKKQLEEAITKQLTDEIIALLAEQQQEKATTTPIINTIYRKIRNQKRSIEAFHKATLIIDINWQWKGEI